MPAPAGPGPELPEPIEDRVLEILEGDDAARPERLRQLVQEHPEHGGSIARWLLAAGAIDDDDLLRGAFATLPESGPAADGAGAGAPAPQAATDDDHLPRRLGAYLLQQVLGRGGFGTVYRAEQQEPIRRPVAVKLLNPGMDSREVLARFSAEREALNRMDHPGIARLLDAGTTPKGRPFFVMELVDGPTLVHWCRQRNVTTRGRIRLFLQVCDAMQHAHQKAVLHRDLSSNNVLISNPDGRRKELQPKIIDFGIAKSLADPLLEGGAFTFQGTLMGTPEFMSPEQAAGRRSDIDTRTDVYSLGVQLYELLTDQLPIPGVVLRAQGVAGMARVIATHVPARASDVAPAARRSALRGDLDAILRRALAKEREDRYAGVSDLASDLRRHLSDETVQATAPTTWYRLRKFVRRNRAQSIVSALALLVLLGTLGALFLALQAAEHEAGLKEQAILELQQKADAGFRLLANEERLRRAEAAEQALPPPWPEHFAAYTDWQQRYGERMREELVKIDARIDELDARRERSGGELGDDADRHLDRALRRLRDEVLQFLATNGPAGRAAARLAWGRQVLASPSEAWTQDWQRARDAIRASDGERAHKGYSGLRLPELPGLRPLGCHPDTKLWEFLDLRSHADDYPLPNRDPRTGNLVTDAGTGVVLTLLPAGRIAPGARSNQPGMERNDPNAESDEHNDEIVALEPFLIARTELTVVQWARLTGQHLPNLDPMLPMSNVDWFTARDELQRWGMALPTEVQWEYACRAGTTTPWFGTDDPAVAARRYGHFDGAVDLVVGDRGANAFGLFDMHGNVAEWCRDEKLPYPDFVARPGDGLRARADTAADAWRVVRGGSVASGVLAGRATARDMRPPTARDGAIGLRPVRAVVPQP